MRARVGSSCDCWSQSAEIAEAEEESRRQAHLADIKYERLKVDEERLREQHATVVAQARQLSAMASQQQNTAPANGGGAISLHHDPKSASLTLGALCRSYRRAAPAVVAVVLLLSLLYAWSVGSATTPTHLQPEFLRLRQDYKSLTNLYNSCCKGIPSPAM